MTTKLLKTIDTESGVKVSVFAVNPMFIQRVIANVAEPDKPTYIAVTSSGCESEQAVTGDSVEYGAPAPHLEGNTLGGEKVSSTSLAGNPVILTFWATTCAPCKRELPMLQQVASEYSAKNLQVLAINTAETPQQISEFFDEISVDLPVLIDQDGTLIDRFEVLFLPMTYFIDSSWVLQYKTVGEPSEKQLAYGLSSILSAS